MSEDLLKIIKVVSLVVFVFSVAVYVYQHGQSIDQAYPNKTFSVDGDAKIAMPTDIATFTASVITEGAKDVVMIQNQNTEKMNTLNAFLSERGVEKKDLQTSEYTLNPRYTYGNCEKGTCPPPTIVGYTLNQSLTIKVRNLEALGDILAGITSKGANTVSGVKFTVDDVTEAKRIARIEAIEKAKKKALEIAQAGDFRVGKLIAFYEDPGMPLGGENAGVGGRDSMMSIKSEASPIIEPGTVSDTVRVTLTYEIIN